MQSEEHLAHSGGQEKCLMLDLGGVLATDWLYSENATGQNPELKSNDLYFSSNGQVMAVAEVETYFLQVTSDEVYVSRRGKDIIKILHAFRNQGYKLALHSSNPPAALFRDLHVFDASNTLGFPVKFDYATFFVDSETSLSFSGQLQYYLDSHSSKPPHGSRLWNKAWVLGFICLALSAVFGKVTTWGGVISIFTSGVTSGAFAPLILAVIGLASIVLSIISGIILKCSSTAPIHLVQMDPNSAQPFTHAIESDEHGVEINHSPQDFNQYFEHIMLYKGAGLEQKQFVRQGLLTAFPQLSKNLPDHAVFDDANFMDPNSDDCPTDLLPTTPIHYTTYKIGGDEGDAKSFYDELAAHYLKVFETPFNPDTYVVTHEAAPSSAPAALGSAALPAQDGQLQIGKSSSGGRQNPQRPASGGGDSMQPPR